MAPYAVVTVQWEAMVPGVGDPAVKPLMLYIVILVSAQTLSHQRYMAGSTITVFKTKALAQGTGKYSMYLPVLPVYSGPLPFLCLALTACLCTLLHLSSIACLPVSV